MLTITIRTEVPGGGIVLSLKGSGGVLCAYMLTGVGEWELNWVERWGVWL